MTHAWKKFICCVALAHCAPRVSLIDVGDRAALQRAVGYSVAWMERQAPDKTMARHRVALSAFADFLATAPNERAIEAYVLAHFELRGAAALFTGYYEPEVAASLERTAEYASPIHALPSDLIDIALDAFSAKLKGQHIVARIDGTKVVPYYSRAHLPATLPVLAWARDPVDVFFAEIQGSASLRLPDGTLRRIGFAGKNGRPYRAVGNLLIQEGQIKKEDMSMQAIRTWLAEHPDERERVLQWNESAVFFRFLEGEPLGALGVPVTPERSVATDLSVFPRGALLFVRFTLPDGVTFARFVLNQDTGGAIIGPNRVDVFFGRGKRAVTTAGHLQAKGELWLLLPK